MPFRIVLFVVPLLLAATVARAEESASVLRALSADPNAARFGLMFRGAMRAQIGATLVLRASESATETGFALSLSPLVELHEPSGSDQVLPSQYWRARVAVVSSYGWQVDQERYRASIGLEHESDHETAHEYSTPGFLTQNALALGGYGQWSLGAIRLGVAPVARVYLLSCTSDRERCSDFRGDASVGAQLDVTLDAPAWDLASLVPFVSTSAAFVAVNGLVRSERHVELHFGLWCATQRLLFQMFALAYFGNDVGILRAQRITQLGFGISLSPRED